METLSCHSNQNSYQSETKIYSSFPLPVDGICAIWKELTSRLQRCRLKMLMDDGQTDGQTPDVSIYYKLTFFEETF